MAESKQPVTVPMEIKYKGAWLTWVAATNACLNALGVKCDLWDVAGVTGYAYLLTIHRELCPSGPTMFDWGMLDFGVNLLGRSTVTFGCGDCHTGEYVCERTTAHCRQAFELAKREIDAGRPVVIWGAYVPEFAVAYMYEGDNYIVKSYKTCIGEEDTPIPFDKLDAPGGPYVMAFPTPSAPPRRQFNADQYAVAKALQLLTQESLFRSHLTGLAAYDVWINALEQNIAHPFGLAYNSQCWAEARAFARGYMPRVVERNSQVAGPLGKAAAAFADTEMALIELAKAFPFPPKDEAKDEAVRKHAIEALKDAKAADERAVEALRETMETPWEMPKQAAG